MGKLLPKKEYKFKSITEEELNQGHVIYLYCDNLQEGMHILFWLEEYNSEMTLIKRGYQGISKYIGEYEIEGERYHFVISSFYHNGELPTKVRQTINKIDKPDVVMYSKDKDCILCGIENTETCFVGNASWQRHGRIINFLKNDFPFLFFAYYSKKDASRGNIRQPSPLFVLSFLALSVEYSTPAIISLYEHEDKEQNRLNADGTRPIDTRKDATKYILDLIRFGKEDVRTKACLKKCISNMKYYYNKEIKRIKNKELPSNTLKILRKDNLEDEMIQHMENRDNDYPFFSKGNVSKKYLFDWSPVTKKEISLNDEKVGIKEYMDDKFKGIHFYELSPKCPVGITFQTKELINRLEELKDTGDYYWVDTLNEELPTLFTLMRLTKKGKLELPDPYNGRIPAFYELYQQSFPKMNNIILLIDHTNNKEYEVEDAKNMKIYKSINDYATMMIDLDFNIMSINCDKAVRDRRKKYVKEITEDNVTCFFETILKLENIKPSFINPPCSSWSDLRLYPTDNYMYVHRDSDRPDIAIYSANEEGDFLKGTYYIGESKANVKEFKKDDSYNKQINRIERLSKMIEQNIDLPIEYKTFILFYGKQEEVEKILQDIKDNKKKRTDYIVLIQENSELEEDITLTVIEVEL